MKTIRAYKTELDPTNEQRTWFLRCAGAARFVYNWALAEWEEWYELGGFPSEYAIRRYFTSIKDELCPWIRGLRAYAIQESAFRNLNSAFQRYFKEKADGTVAKRVARLQTDGKWESRKAKLAKKGRIGYKAEPGYPQFKSKRDSRQSFQLRNVIVESDRVKLTGIGWVRLKETGYLPTDSGLTVYATISQTAGRWYISVQAEESKPALIASGGIVGVDFGISHWATCSDGTVFDNPKVLEQAERKLARLQCELSRRTQGGQNWHKTKAKIARCYAKIANVRQHALHQISHYITVKAKPQIVAIEDLNVSGMLKNHHLARAISDVAFGELRRQIEYKAQWYGIEVIVADRFWPSSKACSRCGCVKSNLTLADRTYTCDDCGLVIDRDLNAALNLAALGKAKTSPDCLGSCGERRPYCEPGTEQPLAA